MKRIVLSGMTLLELIIGIGIFTLLLSLTLPFATRDIVRTHSVSDHSAAISLLRSARDQAIANVNEQNTGFYSDTSAYVLFSGDTYQTRQQELDVRYARTQSLLPTGLEVRFASPTGIPTILINGQTQTAYTFTTTDPVRNRVLELSINEEGLIDWRQ